MTEEEAKEKWCPLTYCCDCPGMCIASKCMAWGWDIYMESDSDPDDPLLNIKKGHCGLVK